MRRAAVSSSHALLEVSHGINRCEQSDTADDDHHQGAQGIDAELAAPGCEHHPPRIRYAIQAPSPVTSAAVKTDIHC